MFTDDLMYEYLMFKIPQLKDVKVFDYASDGHFLTICFNYRPGKSRYANHQDVRKFVFLDYITWVFNRHSIERISKTK